ncbi:hypothetical protein MBLNU459_g8276t1 [Dothideomycetes sp. NU459]
MPSALKRKSPPPQDVGEESAKRRFAEAAPQANAAAETVPGSSGADGEVEPSESAPPDEPVDNAAAARQARFAALRARNTDSRKANLKATAAETQRVATDPALLHSLNRKRDTAQEKLLKADTEEAGEDYERKRAWDWTVEESEKWDRRLEKKQKHRDNAKFQDFSQDARKVYKRQLQEMKPDIDGYERDKLALIEKAAASGSLEVVETEDGELMAVDRDGTFYSTADSTDFVANKPTKDAIDKLVGQIQKSEDVRLRNRKNRKNDDDGADVTYINDKNKQFNQKLARFYNKYTGEIRESFERGTAL